MGILLMELQAMSKEGIDMLSWAVIFAIIALVAAILGFGTLAGIAATFFKWIFVAFVILFIISLFTGRRGVTTL